MIFISLFTSGKHTQPVIKVLEKAETVKLLNIYPKLPPAGKIARADLFLVADFGEIVPPEIFQLPKHNTLCLHPSLLPKYRGASPVPYAILNADKVTGVTIFELDEKIDHGSIIAQLREPIRLDDTQASLLARLFQKGAQELVRILPDYISGRIKPRLQNHSQATYTKRLTRLDGRIDWQKSDEEIERFIRAMHPWPGAWTIVKSKRLKILKARLKKDKLVIDEVQLEAKNPITWPQFKAGYPEISFR